MNMKNLLLTALPRCNSCGLSSLLWIARIALPNLCARTQHAGVSLHGMWLWPESSASVIVGPTSPNSIACWVGAAMVAAGGKQATKHPPRSRKEK